MDCIDNLEDVQLHVIIDVSEIIVSSRCTYSAAHRDVLALVDRGADSNKVPIASRRTLTLYCD